MAVLAALVGALVGFVVGVVFTEVIFANNADWPTVIPFVLAVVGWMSGRDLVRRRRSRPPEHGAPSTSR